MRWVGVGCCCIRKFLISKKKFQKTHKKKTVKLNKLFTRNEHVSSRIQLKIVEM